MFEGYDVIEPVHVGEAYIVQRLRRRADGALLIAKDLCQAGATTSHAARLRHAHSMLLRAQQACVPNITDIVELVDTPEQLVLITRDIGGISLQALQNARALTVIDILHVASEVLAMLANLHASDVVHLGLGRNTIVYNPDSKRVNVINFGQSRELSRAATGHRADIRALGKTLASLLQGNLVAQMPRSVRRVVASMVHPSRDSAVPTASELASDLRIAVVEAHELAIKLQRESTEIQMAGGFAHEMRNALAGALYMAEDVFSAKGILGDIHAHIRQVKNISSLAQDTRPALQACISALETEHNTLTDAADVFTQSLSRAKGIITSILDYANVSYVQPNNSRTSVTHALNIALSQMQLDLTRANINIVKEQFDECFVNMCEEHAATLFTNVLHNAHDALKHTERARTITVRIQRRHGRVRVEMKDNGIGMAPAVKRLVFQPFFTTKGINGRGLGLALARKLCQAYGGTIEFSSVLARGTIFKIDLPVCPD